MNRNEFLDKLSQALAERKVENVTEILADFNAHFDEAVRDGQSEAEVCEMLGDPAEIAEQFAEDYAYSPHTEDETVSSEGIYVDAVSANVVLIPHDGEGFLFSIEHHGLRVDFEENGNEFVIEQTEKYLSVTEARSRGFASWVLGMLNSKTIEIMVPRSFFADINLRLVSGNVEIRGISRAKSVLINQVSGNSRIFGLNADDMLVKNKSGNIKLEGCSGDIMATGFSGGITIAGHSGNVSAGTQSGLISVETDTISKYSEFTTKSGGVKLKLNLLNGDVLLKCVSGNIGLTITDSLNANVTGKTTSGNVTAYLPMDTRADFRLHSSGVKNDFETAPAAGALPIVSLSTTSGSTKVKRL